MFEETFETATESVRGEGGRVGEGEEFGDWGGGRGGGGVRENK